MTTLIPTLERALLQAAQRTNSDVASTATHAVLPSAGRRIRHRRTYPLAALVVGCLTVTGGAYAARGLWMPELGSDSYGHAIATSDPLPGSESTVLAVLRREQTDADRDTAVRGVLHGASPSIGAIRTNAVRRLGTLPDGRVAVLVPAHMPRGFDPTLPKMTQDQLLLGVYDPANHDMSGFIVSDALGMRAGNLMLQTSRRQTSSQQSRAEAFLDHEVAMGRLHRRPAPPYFGVMSVEQTRRYRAALGVTDRDPVDYIGVVPDGVTRVQVDGHTSVPVKDNFFVAPSTVGSTQPTIWFDAHGDVVPFASTLGTWK